jgi:hypothetical protein
MGEGLGSGLVRGVAGDGLFRTPGGIAHNLLGAAGVLGAVLLPFVITKIVDIPRLRLYSSLTTAAGLLFLVLFGLGTLFAAEGSWISYKGLWQRLFMLIYYLFFMRVAVLMLEKSGTFRPFTYFPETR